VNGHERQWAAALSFLRANGAEGLEHPGGSLFDHLERTAEILAGWNARPAMVLAGLCHAIYGTDGFPHPLAALTARDEIREMLGTETEAIVYLYAASDRTVTWPHIGERRPVPCRDRFTDVHRTLTAAEAQDYWELTTANEFDLKDRTASGPETLQLLHRGAWLLNVSTRQALTNELNLRHG
jgi:hypothetical protein